MDLRKLTLPIVFAAAIVGAMVVGTDFQSSIFADGFAVEETPSGQAGPHAVVERDGDLYVSSRVDGYLYKFDSQGGTASPSLRVGAGSAPALPGLAGLCVARDQRVYVTRLDPSEVLELDPASGAVIRSLGVPG